MLDLVLAHGAYEPVSLDADRNESKVRPRPQLLTAARVVGGHWIIGAWWSVRARGLADEIAPRPGPGIGHLLKVVAVTERAQRAPQMPYEPLRGPLAGGRNRPRTRRDEASWGCFAAMSRLPLVTYW
jgi:hypothetical protein